MPLYIYIHDGISETKHCCYCLSTKWMSGFFHGNLFLLEIKDWHKLWFFRQVLTLSEKWVKWGCHFKEKNWQYLLPPIPFGFKKIRILESLCRSLWAYHLLETSQGFSGEMVGGINMYPLSLLMMKYVNVWNICITVNQYFSNDPCMT